LLDFSLGPTIANSVSFVVTFIVENLLKKQNFKTSKPLLTIQLTLLFKDDILGLALVVAGVLLCAY